MNSGSLRIDHTWTLFLDRDGVINRRIIGGYVTEWSQFEFLPGVLQAVKTFSDLFGRIIVVTNQQGISKGLMTEDSVQSIHLKMIEMVRIHGGKIDQAYFCGDFKDSGSLHRKPAPGMAYQAKKDYPEIDFNRSIMVGDSISDILFGKSVKMSTIFISTKSVLQNENPDLIDYVFPDLLSFSKYLFND
ncbi:MAG: HAD-IIIA family hydrolase [Bacteroidota bacterium]